MQSLSLSLSLSAAATAAVCSALEVEVEWRSSRSQVRQCLLASTSATASCSFIHPFKNLPQTSIQPPPPLHMLVSRSKNHCQSIASNTLLHIALRRNWLQDSSSTRCYFDDCEIFLHDSTSHKPLPGTSNPQTRQKQNQLHLASLPPVITLPNTSPERKKEKKKERKTLHPSMGRGRGRGRKIVTNGRTHEEKGSSGEEVLPARKRRGRPLKQRAAVADKPDLSEANILVQGVDGNADYQQGQGDDAKLKENYSQDSNAGNKRNRAPKEEMSSNNNDMEENNSWSTRSSNDESTATRSSGGFRLNGSRRKSTPRRAAEAGL